MLSQCKVVQKTEIQESTYRLYGTGIPCRKGETRGRSRYKIYSHIRVGNPEDWKVDTNEKNPKQGLAT